MLWIILGFHFLKLILERRRKRERGRQKHWFVCCSTYLYTHGLLLVRALTGDQTGNLDTLGQGSNQPARAYTWFHFNNNVELKACKTFWSPYPAPLCWWVHIHYYLYGHHQTRGSPRAGCISPFPCWALCYPASYV